MAITNKIIITKQHETPLSKEQKQFNRLNSEIAKEQELLLTWQNQILGFKNIYHNELTRLQNQHSQLRMQIVYLLDAVYANKIFTKNERKKIIYIIEEVAQDLAADDEKVKEIYNRHSGNDYDDEQTMLNNAAMDYMKAAAAEKLDINLEHIDNPEDLMQELLKQMQEQMEATETHKTTRKKSAKTLAQDVKKAKENQEISQSIKEVYRQLVRTLHPDRETDLDERVRKTELMQKINIAYAKHDLITLLQMQLEVEQIDQHSINSLSIEKIKHYNAVLKKQLQEIKQEVYFVREQFNMEFEVPRFFTLTPDKIILKIKSDVKEIQEEINQLTNELKLWENPQNLKNYLKEFKPQSREKHSFPLWAQI